MAQFPFRGLCQYADDWPVVVAVDRRAAPDCERRKEAQPKEACPDAEVELHFVGIRFPGFHVLITS